MRELAEELRTRVENTEFSEVGHFTCSIGMTELKAEDTPEAAFERVDKALYQAKKAGRNGVVSADING